MTLYKIDNWFIRNLMAVEENLDDLSTFAKIFAFQHGLISTGQRGQSKLQVEKDTKVLFRGGNSWPDTNTTRS